MQLTVAEKLLVRRAHEHHEGGDSLSALRLMYTFLDTVDRSKHAHQRHFVWTLLKNITDGGGTTSFDDEKNVIAKAYQRDAPVLYALGQLLQHRAPFRARRCIARAFLRCRENERIVTLHDFYFLGAQLFDRMICFKRRNISFTTALLSLLKDGDPHNVLIIGGGAGLLAIKAKRHAASVDVFECTPTFYPIAFDNIARAEVEINQGNVTMKKNISPREPSYDTFVFETMDSSGLTGGDLITLFDGVHKLTAPSANLRTLPSHITIYVQLLESPSYLDSAIYVDPSDSTRYYANGREEGEREGSRYSNMRLRDFPDHRILSDRVEVLTVDLGDAEALEQLLGEFFAVEISLTPSYSGTVHAFLVSFKLTLAPGLELDPTTQTDSAWDYAAFPRASRQIVNEGEAISICARVVNGALAFPYYEHFDCPVLVRDPVHFKFPDGFLTWANNAEAKRFLGEDRIMQWLTSLSSQSDRFVDDLMWPLWPDGRLHRRGINDMQKERQRYRQLQKQKAEMGEKYHPIVARLTCKGMLFRSNRLDSACRFRPSAHLGTELSASMSPIVEVGGIRSPFHVDNDFVALSDPGVIFVHEGIVPAGKVNDPEYAAVSYVDGMVYWWVVEHVDPSIAPLDTLDAGLPVAAALFPMRAAHMNGDTLPVTIHDYLSSFLVLAGSEQSIKRESVMFARRFESFMESFLDYDI